MFEFEETTIGQARIKVVGVGGAGGNVVNNMVASSIKSVEFVAVNTDAQALENSMAGRKVQIGKNITRGLGAGSKPEIGKESALENRDEIADAIEGSDMVFITAGMGGGTGTGAAPVVAEIARESGALTIGIVTKPFFYEGGRRKANADYGVAELRDRVDTMIVIPNDRIAMVVEKGTSILESFAIANNVLKQAVQGISDLILVPGLINLDFADLKTIVKDAGRAVIGMGIAAAGEGSAHEAAKKAILNPLLENNSIDGAQGILINITGGLELALSDVQEATSAIYDSADEDANIIVGAVIDPDVKNEMRVTVIATKFKPEEPKVQLPQVKKWTAAREPISASIKGSDRVLASMKGAERILATMKGSERVLSKSLAERPTQQSMPSRGQMPKAPAAPMATQAHAASEAHATHTAHRTQTAPASQSATATTTAPAAQATTEEKAQSPHVAKPSTKPVGRRESTLDIPTFLRKPLSAFRKHETDF
jgi:cell division protein FtsZ